MEEESRDPEDLTGQRVGAYDCALPGYASDPAGRKGHLLSGGGVSYEVVAMHASHDKFPPLDDGTPLGLVRVLRLGGAGRTIRQP